MRGVVQRWGDGLAVRIPGAFASELGLDADSPVEIVVEGGALVLSPAPRWTLESLVAQITDENLHDLLEAETGRRDGAGRVAALDALWESSAGSSGGCPIRREDGYEDR